MDAPDHDLLTRFRANRDEAAFRLLVDRHIGMVYSVARRVTANSALAEEVAQSTFTKLADKSAGITRETALAGWLYQTSRRLALSAVRSDARRRQREQIAAAMNLNEPGPSVVAEHLEAAMDELKPDDRDALVLRFFEDRNLRDVGHELGLTEDAARMRVNRALEQLREIFGKLGITGTAAWLGTTLTTSATASVPAGLGATITTAVLSGTAVATATAAVVAQTTATTMNLFNLKTAAAIVAAAAVTGTTTYFIQEREAGRLRADYQTLHETHGKLAAEQQEARELIQLRDEQIAALKREVADLPRLRGELDKLNRNLAGKAALEAENAALRQQVQSARATPNQASPVADTQPPEVELDERFLERYGQWTADDVAKAQQRRLDRHRQLGDALLAHADASGGWFPQYLMDAKPYLTEQFDLTTMKLLFTGNIRDLKDPSRTLIARQDHRSKFAEGDHVWRVYTFGDGHAEVITATTIQELTNWENERIIPPESQSRRP